MAKTILVIDDDRTIHVLLKGILGKAGYSVVQAMDGMQGTMMARQSKPDLIILDINMPAGGGQSVYERIKQMTGTSLIPILIYSSVSADKVKAGIPESEDTKFLSKPAAPEAILAAVKQFLPA